MWAGVGLVRGNAGTALVGSHSEVAERIEEYRELGCDEFILSGFPHLEEAYWGGRGRPAFVEEVSMSSSVEQAVEAIRRGGMIVVVDDEDRENEGDLIVAAERATPEALAFMVRHGSGIVCVAMERERLEQLELPRAHER